MTPDERIELKRSMKIYKEGYKSQSKGFKENRDYIIARIAKQNPSYNVTLSF